MRISFFVDVGLIQFLKLQVVALKSFTEADLTNADTSIGPLQRSVALGAADYFESHAGIVQTRKIGR
ncbi:MAG: hypothetical protein LW878_09480 [Proteobacteria bacterium]|nr:hypothetical protein [Pseudomonadota bacterium]